MTHTYKVSGMTCSGCQAKVQAILSKVPGVSAVAIDLQKGEASINMQKHVATEQLQSALKDYPKYQLSESEVEMHHTMEKSEEETKSWFATYKPILLIFAYLTTITILIELVNHPFNWMRWMNHFMAGFFLVFSFFKLLDLRGFAESYSTYDIIATRWMAWGYIYAFTELTLGLAYLTGFKPVLTNIVTFTVLTVSIIGVLKSVLNKRKIKCACLGAAFNLPMSTVTIVEDALMMAMSGIMLNAIM